MKTREITREIRDRETLEATLRDLSSTHGGAWSFVHWDFTVDFKFVRFASPSRVPDEYLAHSHNRIGYKGKLVPFTPAAQAREQNRMSSRD